MAVIVEDGSIVANANSYVSEAELTAYALARGKTLTADETQLLIEAMDYIEGLSFIGIKHTQDQALQWPRSYVRLDGYYQNHDDIPAQLKNGLMATAIAIDEGNSPLSDIEKDVQREAIAGVIDVTYSSGAASNTIVRTINNALKKLLSSGAGSFKVSKG